MNVLELPLIAEDREIRGFKPFKALKHFRNLVADKEDTKQVFFIIEALAGNKVFEQATGFIATDEAHEFMGKESELGIADMLDDHARWVDCGHNSVALNRLRDTHDLFHVLTGYGRDALGEAALLGFSYEQNHNLGVKFIAYAAARQIKKVTGTSAPLYAAIREGRDLGKAAAKLAHMDVEAVMRMDIADARTMLNVGEPVMYRQCLAQLEAEGHSGENLDLSEAQAA